MQFSIFAASNMKGVLKRYNIYIGVLIVLLGALVLIRFSISHGKADSAATTRHVEPEKWQDLKGRTIAVTLGSASDFILSKILPTTNIMRMRTPSEVLAVVESGQADYATVDYMDVRSTDLESKNLKIVFKSFDLGGHLAFAFNPKEEALCRQYNAFFDSIVRCGRFDTLKDRWSVNNIDTVEMPEFPKLSGTPVEVATFGSGSPFSFYKNNTWYGWEIELLLLFGQHIGRPMHFSDYDFSALTTAVSKGKADIAAGHLFITDERSRKMLFSEPYYYSPEVCVSRIDPAEKFSSITKSEFKSKLQSNLLVENRWKMLLRGLWETLLISFWSLLLGTILGILLCFLQRRKVPLLRLITKGFNGFMQSVPVLVVLMIMFYIVLADSGISATKVAVFAFALSVGSDLCEIFRANIESVDKGQIEACRALGVGKFRCFQKIVLPQALKKILPQYKSEINALIKNTSIVGYVAIQDLTKMGDIIRSRTFDAFFPLIIVSIVYIITALILNLILDRILFRNDKI